MENDLLKKYNYPVPRYTSYPPANFFREGYTGNQFEEAIRQSNHWLPENISFYVHIPFCPKRCHFCGCNSFAINQKETIHAYIQALKTEIGMVLPLLDKSRQVTQIHYGGGTPNAIPAHYLKEINQLFFSAFQLTEQAEIAIECNPAHITYEQLDELKEAGFNRFSLGIQDFDEEVLKAVNRDPSKLPVEDIMSYLRKGNQPAGINLDFIFGLPRQTVSGFATAIEKAIQLRPDRLVTFSYAHVPWAFPNQKNMDEQKLPSQTDKTRMFEEASTLLTKNGYTAIGFDHFALESDELARAHLNRSLHRNFQGYCTRETTGQVYAFGVTAISQLQGVYAQNIKTIRPYVECINRNELPVFKGYELNRQEMMIRELITELLCNRRIIWDELARRFNLTREEFKTLLNYDETQLDRFRSDGLIRYNDEQLEMTDEGLLFTRIVAASFDPLLENTENQFSKPV